VRLLLRKKEGEQQKEGKYLKGRKGKKGGKEKKVKGGLERGGGRHSLARPLD